jgi:citrate synthase
MVLAMSSFYPDAIDVSNTDQIDITIARLLAKVRTIAAFAYKKSIGQPFVYPKNSLSYCANFMNMMFSVPAEPYEVDEEIVKVMNLLLILHADHEQNCSTATVRMVASSKANLFASASAGVCALWGPLHGGANQAVLEMLAEIHKSGDDGSKFITAAKDKNSGKRLMGFGHRVYRAEDPRARVLRRTARELDAPRYEVAVALEQAALEELRSRRPDRVLETNVEFWAAIVLDFAQVPAQMFTAMFTCARLAGWSAHVLEQKKTGRLIRPSARYVGPAPRRPEDVAGWDAELVAPDYHL